MSKVIKTPLQRIIDGDLLTQDGLFYARKATNTNLFALSDILQKAENTLMNKAKEARERNDTKGHYKLYSDMLTFRKSLKLLGSVK